MYDVKVEEKLSRGTNSTKRTDWGEKGESMDVWEACAHMYDIPLGKWPYVDVGVSYINLLISLAKQ